MNTNFEIASFTLLELIFERIVVFQVGSLDVDVVAVGLEAGQFHPLDFGHARQPDQHIADLELTVDRHNHFAINVVSALVFVSAVRQNDSDVVYMITHSSATMFYLTKLNLSLGIDCYRFLSIANSMVQKREAQSRSR